MHSLWSKSIKTTLKKVILEQYEDNDDDNDYGNDDDIDDANDDDNDNEKFDEDNYHERFFHWKTNVSYHLLSKGTAISPLLLTLKRLTALSDWK